MAGQEHNIISISGGKDSTALLLLAIERQPDNLQAVFADTGHEHPQTYEYVRYLEQSTGVPIRWVKADFSADINEKRDRLQRVINGEQVPRNTWDSEQAGRALEFLHPTGNPFFDLCLLKGRFPSTKARFCSEELKRNPIIEQVQLPIIDQGDDVVSWQGVRADESASRANLAELEHKGTWPNGAEMWNYRPILKWTAQDCFDMHKKHGIKHNPLYEQGMGRVGCMPCIHARKNELLEISKRFPDEIKRVAAWEKIVAGASKRGGATFFSATGMSNEEAASQTIDVFVEWSKTSRGGRQYDFLRADNDNLPLCTSIYGLCE